MLYLGRLSKKHDRTNSSCGRAGPEPIHKGCDLPNKLLSKYTFAAVYTCDGAALMPQCQSQIDVGCGEEQDLHKAFPGWAFPMEPNWDRSAKNPGRCCGGLSGTVLWKQGKEDAGGFPAEAADTQHGARQWGCSQWRS